MSFVCKIQSRTLQCCNTKGQSEVKTNHKNRRKVQWVHGSRYVRTRACLIQIQSFFMRSKSEKNENDFPFLEWMCLTINKLSTFSLFLLRVYDAVNVQLSSINNTLCEHKMQINVVALSFVSTLKFQQEKKWKEWTETKRNEPKRNESEL